MVALLRCNIMADSDKKLTRAQKKLLSQQSKSLSLIRDGLSRVEDLQVKLEEELQKANSQSLTTQRDWHVKGGKSRWEKEGARSPEKLKAHSEAVKRGWANRRKKQEEEQG